ncbi:MAG: YdeI/OmpD-associated family protein [Phormidium tanganyikae FI6-MK23]|nr:YdeI/OmpD-associated family protein [Phormidium tanganyikae FI6-MK23]
MAKFEDQLDKTEAIDRATWRRWLEQNHQSAIGIWLIYYKVKSGKLSVSYSEAVKEALCFGWIDSKVKSIVIDRYMQIFTPRKPQSVWSKLNKQYLEELFEQGLMTEAGIKKIEAAKLDGSWTLLDAIEALIIPPDLAEALGRNAIAQQNFESFSNSTKKVILYWIDSAKRPETRQTRIEKTLIAVVQNRSPLDRSSS